MGCISSCEHSESSDHPEEKFKRRFWRSLTRNYKVKQEKDTPLPVTPQTLSVEDFHKEGFVEEEEKSDGYYSGTLSTANTSDISFDPNDCDLKMEMYMMTKISRVMPKTSSPILPRSSSAASSDEEMEPRSYTRWKQNLQLTPPYVLTNITRIPEAIAGQITPEGFPMYTDKKRCFPEKRQALV